MTERYTMGKAAEKLGVHKNTLYRWEKAGSIKPVKRLARTGERIYTDDDIEAIRAWMDRTVEPSAPTTGNKQKPKK